MNTNVSSKSDLFFPPAENNWADKLFIAGLVIYAFCSSFSIAASQIGLGLALIAFITLYRTNKVDIKVTSFDSPYAFLALAGILAVFRAEQPMLAITGLKTFLIVLCFYLAYWPGLKKGLQEVLLQIFFVSSALIAALTCRNLLQDLIEGLHAKGFFSMCITFGECQALAAVTLVFYLVSRPHGLRKKLMLSAALFMIVVAVILSFTRGAWLGFATGLIVLTTGFPRKMLPVILIVCILVPSMVYFSPYLKERISGLNVTKIIETADKSFEQKFESVAVMSGFQRLYIWLRGFTMLRENMSFGVGAKNIKYHYNLLATEYEHQNSLIWGHQHNNFMQMLVKFGFIGLIAFFYFIISIFKFILKNGRIITCGIGKAHIGAIAVFGCFLVFGLTENAWGDEEVSMMAFFLTGLLMSSSGETIAQN
ncbi:MAG: O-antigen ligase family protein [Candidatus Riflebacteria bacterium]|nr:O-antigen ligase family protein [Candidatus Riflebacteria bacterium]